MLVALVAASPLGLRAALPAIAHPTTLLAAIGVGICSSVIPYVTDQLAMARIARATYAMLVALLPAVATVVGAIVLTQIPSMLEVAGVAFIVAAVAVHRERPRSQIANREEGEAWSTCGSAPRG